jgi:hypothetical protein
MLLIKLKKDRDLSDLDIVGLDAQLLDKNQSEINALDGIYSQKDYQQLIKYYLKLRVAYEIKDQNQKGELVSYLPVIIENQTAPISKFYEITLSAETTATTTTTGSGGGDVLNYQRIENYKLKEVEVGKLHVHNEKDYEIMETITESGNKLRLTPNHPIIINENNNFKKAYKIKEGEKY